MNIIRDTLTGCRGGAHAEMGECYERPAPLVLTRRAVERDKVSPKKYISEQVLKVVEDNNYPVRGTLGARTPSNGTYCSSPSKVNLSCNPPGLRVIETARLMCFSQNETTNPRVVKYRWRRPQRWTLCIVVFWISLDLMS